MLFRSQAAALTRQLLAFGRRQVLEPQLLDMNAAVKDAAKLLRRVLAENIELTLVLAPDLGSIRVDPVQLQQVIINLAINARDAMPEGGRLTIETHNAELGRGYVIRRLPVKVGRYVMLAVADSGIGMDTETQERIFDPFFTTKKMGHGTGLGLSTVYGIVKQSGGYIWVYSEVDHGTTFKIYLPVVEEDAEPESQGDTRPAILHDAVLHPITVLIVEDEKMLRDLISEVCTRAGFTVLEAANGAEALAACQNCQTQIA